MSKHTPGPWEQDADGVLPSPVEEFRILWESLYPGSWDANEWVWVTEFERCDKPEGWPNA